jgi:alpha-beta hydrolase superfamily lysophospholipase
MGARLARALVVLIALQGCAPFVEGLGPPVAAPALSPGPAAERFVAADGAILPVRAWLPQSARPRAVLIALHGFNDYSHFFAEPAAFFAARGIAAYAYDQRGFGMAPHPGLWAGTEAMVADLKAFVRLVRARHAGVPLFLLGDSMGGAVAMVAMTDSNPPPVDGAILVAPAVWGRVTMPWYQRLALAIGAHTVPWLKVSGRGLNITPSDNIEMLRALARDPLVIKDTRVDSVYGLVNLMDEALDRAARFDARALILYGQKDEIIPKAPTLRMLERRPEAARARQRVAIYPDGYHMLLRDLAAETFWQDIAAWIEDPAQALPSGADKTPLAALAE